MQFGKDIATACSTFAITNVDDMFVLVTFFAQSSTSEDVTPLGITSGQYIGFTIIVIISMVGFGIAVVLPTEPIGFLGLVPILLSVWKLFDLVFPNKEEEQEAISSSNRSRWRTVFTVSSITVMNGGDNIGTYIPLFSQVKGADIAVYVVIYYILQGVWCLIAWFVMKQRHILRLARQYAKVVVPFLYMGLGVYIIAKSSCFQWSIERINRSFHANPGKAIMSCMTTTLLLGCIGLMLWFKLRKKATQRENNVELGSRDQEDINEDDSAIRQTEEVGDQIKRADRVHKGADRQPGPTDQDSRDKNQEVRVVGQTTVEEGERS